MFFFFVFLFASKLLRQRHILLIKSNRAMETEKGYFQPLTRASEYFPLYLMPIIISPGMESIKIGLNFSISQIISEHFSFDAQARLLMT